jgi:hypothetical protein
MINCEHRAQGLITTMMPHYNYHVGLSKHKIPLDFQTLLIENNLSIPCEPKLTFL